MFYKNWQLTTDSWQVNFPISSCIDDSPFINDIKLIPKTLKPPHLCLLPVQALNVSIYDILKVFLAFEYNALPCEWDANKWIYDER